MKTFATQLLEETDAQLKMIHLEEASALEHSGKAMGILMPALDRLKEFAVGYKFKDPTREIEFFKQLKPRLASRLIYYNEVHNLEAARPFGSPKALRRYYAAELDKLKVFFQSNRDFCTYWRKGSTYLDELYFLRDKGRQGIIMDSCFFQADRRFATSHDYTLAKMMASERLQAFLENEMRKHHSGHPALRVENEGKPLKWPGSKVALVELVYALHAQQIFNGGNSELAAVAAHFSGAFGIELGQFHKTFLEIRERKSDRTKFINALRETLIRRMDAADEN